MNSKQCPLNGEVLNKVISGNVIDWHHSTTGKPCYHWLGHTCSITEHKDLTNA